MNEKEFRDALKRIIGDPPPTPGAEVMLSRAEHRPVEQRSLARFLAGVAISVVLALGVGVVTYNLRARLNQPQIQPIHHAIAASPTLSPRGALPCALPVDISRTGGPPLYLNDSEGFASLPNGTFTADASASGQLASEPKDAITSAGAAHLSYDPIHKRWFPVDHEQVAPDGTQYAYSAYTPAGGTSFTFQGTDLKVYDAASGSSRTVWSTPTQASVLIWSAAGIVVQSIPKGGGSPEDWTIDPSSGKATQGAPSGVWIDDSQAGLLAGANTSFGRDAQGDLIVIKRSASATGSPPPGSPYSVTIYKADGTQIPIYSGTVGDSTGFSPFSAYRQGSEIWFTDSSLNRLWLWTSQGLQRFALTGVPPMPPGLAHPIEIAVPAGPCT